jgi:hypothetical protein
LRNCKICGGKRWYAVIDKSTGLQKSDKEGRLLYSCFRNPKHIQAEEHAYPTLTDRGNVNVLYFDLEVSKSLYYNYGRKVHSGYLNGKDLVHEYFIISWAASYMNSNKVFSACVTPQQALSWTDKEILAPLHDLLSSADIVTGHNVDAFDMKKINTRFISNGFAPILDREGKKPKPSVDSLKIARTRFAFEDNGLDALCKKFGIKGKDKITDDDWRRILQIGDEKTLKKIDKYCRGDVKNGKELLKIFIPYSGKNYDYGALKALSKKCE